MDTEEKYIFERCGKKNPFHTPEGYFDSLTAQVLAKVDTIEKAKGHESDGKLRIAKREPSVRPVTLHIVSRKTILRRWIAAVSIAGVAILTSTIWFSQSRKATPKSEEPAAIAVSSSSGNDAYIDEMANYTAMDNDDIYNYCVEQN